MIFDDFDNAMEANEIHGSDRDEYNEFLDATGDDVSEYAEETVVFEDEDGEWEIEDEFAGMEMMDGDFDSGMASAGYGTDEDYRYYGDSDLGGEY